jgi:two-component system OmpR family sensor kinase
VTVRVGEGGGWAELSVTDHGPGLTAEQAANVFEPFYRADPARGRVPTDRTDGPQDEGPRP